MWSLCVFDTGSLVTDTKVTLEMANVVKTVPWSWNKYGLKKITWTRSKHSLWKNVKILYTDYCVHFPIFVVKHCSIKTGFRTMCYWVSQRSRKLCPLKLIERFDIFLHQFMCPCRLNRGVRIISDLFIGFTWDSIQDFGNCPLNTGWLLNTEPLSGGVRLIENLFIGFTRDSIRHFGNCPLNIECPLNTGPA